MKNQKRPFYNFYMKFMMYLDHSIWKFPIPSVGEGGKRRGKLSHWLYKLKFLPVCMYVYFAMVQKYINDLIKDSNSYEMQKIVSSHFNMTGFHSKSIL